MNHVLRVIRPLAYLLALLFISQYSLGQQANKRLCASLFFAGGNSYFSTNVHVSQTHYATPEIRGGLKLSHRINDKIELELRPAYGIKFSANKKGTLSPDDFLQESTSISYKFLELPIAVNYSFGRIVKIKSGLSTRLFKSGNNIPYGFLEGKLDFGILTGASLRVSKRICLGAEYTFGLTKVLEMGYYNSQVQPQNGVLFVRNRIAQITLEYQLSKLVK
jgi:hypothetical protein